MAKTSKFQTIYDITPSIVFPLPIWNILDADHPALPDDIARIYPEIKNYATEFLCAKHPYRKGPVCPFVPSAIEKGLFYFSYLLHEDEDIVCDGVIKLINWLSEVKLKINSFISLMIMFPEDFDLSSLLKIHHRCKIYSIERNIMTGATYGINQAQSLHKEDYFPLRTPSPCLILRDLTPHDLIFLNPKQYKISQRLQFLKSFETVFGNEKIKYTALQVAKAKDLINVYTKRSRKYKIACSLVAIIASIAGIFYVFK